MEAPLSQKSSPTAGAGDGISSLPASRAPTWQLSPEQLSRLSLIASSKETRVETIIQELVSRYFDEEESRFIDAVKRGEAELDRGKHLTHDQVGKRMERLLQS